MRAFARSLALCATLYLCFVPPFAMAQNSDVGGQQTERPNQDQSRPNPLIEGIFDIIIQEAIRQRDETRPTQGDDEQPTTPDTTQPNDGSGPVIVPLRREFTSDRGRARVEARITDPSGVAAAFVRVGGTRLRMAGAGQAVYGVNVPLPSHYKPMEVIIEARDIHGNRARPVDVVLRRVAACGRGGGENLALVRSVQTSLKTLSLYGGAIDGLAGPNTCGAIKTADVAEPFSWPEIARELKIRVDLERVSDVPPAIPRYEPVPPPPLVPDDAPLISRSDARPELATRPGLLTAPARGHLPDYDPKSAGARRISVPDWVVPVAIGFFATLGLGIAVIALFRRLFRRQGPIKAHPVPTLRLVAVPDTSPKTAFAGSNLPGLVLAIDPGRVTAPRIIFDTELEEVP